MRLQGSLHPEPRRSRDRWQSGLYSWTIAAVIHAALVLGASLVIVKRPLPTDVPIGDGVDFQISFAPPAGGSGIPREPETAFYPRMSEERPETLWAGTDEDWGEQQTSFTVSCYEDELGRWRCVVSPARSRR
jgi:hypothetical protein